MLWSPDNKCFYYYNNILNIIPRNVNADYQTCRVLNRNSVVLPQYKSNIARDSSEQLLQDTEEAHIWRCRLCRTESKKKFD